jgi:hypothetical protein
VLCDLDDAILTRDSITLYPDQLHKTKGYQITPQYIIVIPTLHHYPHNLANPPVHPHVSGLTSVTHGTYQPVFERRRILRYILVLGQIQDMVETHHIIVSLVIVLYNPSSPHGLHVVEFDAQVFWGGNDADGLCAWAACWTDRAILVAKVFGLERACKCVGDGVGLGVGEDGETALADGINWGRAKRGDSGGTACALPGGVPIQNEEGSIVVISGSVCGEARSGQWVRSFVMAKGNLRVVC